MKSLIASLFLLLFLCSSAVADEVILKKGNTLSGTITSVDKTSLEIETEYGTLKIPRADIQSACIGRGTGAPAAVEPEGENGIIAEYRFDGNLKDSSKNNNNGASVGGIGFTEDRFNQPNQALNCTGNKSQYVKIEDQPGQHFKMFTLAAWVKGDNPKLWARIIDKYNFNQKKGYALIYNHKEKTIALDSWSTDKKTLWVQTTSKLTNDWQHICVTYDGEELRMYYNGELEAKNNTKATISHTDRYLSIGNGYDGSNYFPWSGKIDDVMIFNRGLSRDEVERLYKEKPGNGSAVDLTGKDSI